MSSAEYINVKEQLLKSVNVSFTEMIEAERLYKEKKLNREEYALKRLLFDPTTLDPEDWKQLRLDAWKEWFTKHAILEAVKETSIELGTNAFLTDLLLSKIKPVSSQGDKHSNITFIQLYHCLNKHFHGDRLMRVLRVMCYSSQLTDGAMASILMACMASNEGERLLCFFEDTGVLRHETETKCVKALKEAHQILRATQTWYTGELLTVESTVALQYMQDLMSRRDFEKDIWTEDMVGRLQPGPVKRFFQLGPNGLIGSEQAYKARAKVVTEHIFTQIANAWATRLQTFDEFWDSRHTWLASGSAPRFHVEIPRRVWNKQDNAWEETGNYEKVRLNKRAAFEGITKAQMVNELNGKPYIWSVGVTKRENGKNRVMYNTQIGHYVAQSYILEQVEPLLGVIAGYDLNDVDQTALDNLRKRHADAVDELPRWMWDYTDFNIQHENADMSLLWLTMAKAIRGVSGLDERGERARAEIAATCEWVAEAEHNCVIMDPSKRLRGHKVRGLLTGSRATQFTNTISNIIYMELLQQQFHELFGRRPITYALNHGDDVYSTTALDTDARALSHIARLMGFAGNVNKVARAFGEYLRIHYEKEYCGGHVLRSIANCVTRDWQTREDYYADEKVKAMLIQFRKTTARGCSINVMQAIFDSEMEFYRTMSVSLPVAQGTMIVKQKHKIQIPREWFYGSVLENASGCGQLSRPAARLSNTIPTLRARVHINRYVRQFYGSQMTDDYWRKMHRLFPRMGQLDRDTLAEVKHTFQADNIMSSLPTHVYKSNKRKYINMVSKFLSKWQPVRYVADEYTDGDTEARYQARLDADLWRRRWTNLEVDVWRFGLNPLLAAERAIARMPSKRKDTLMLWTKALAGAENIDLTNAMIQVVSITTEARGDTNELTQLQTVFSRRVLLDAILGLIPFDAIVDGHMSSEVCQLVRNTAIRRAMEYFWGRSVQITEKKQLQKFVREYELEMLDSLQRNGLRQTFCRP